VLTALVPTVKVALVPLEGTVTLAGTVATEVLLLASVTIAPPDGAGVPSVTVPVEELPLVTEAGLNVKDATGGALVVKATTTEDSVTDEKVVPVAV
jgi:hypothetical protein